MTNILKLAVGAGMAQLITLLASPFLTRLYSPEAFGVLGLFISICQPLSILASGRLDMAVIMERSTTANIAAFAGKMIVLLSVVFFSVIFVFGRNIGELVSIGSFRSYTWFALLYIASTAAYQLRISQCMKFGDFGIVSKVAPMAALSSAIISITFGLIYPDAQTLLLGNLSVSVVGYCLLQRYLRGKRVVTSDGADESVLKKYKSFIVFRAPQDALNSISQNAASVVLGVFFGPAILAQYWMATKVIRLPMNLFQSAISKVFFKDMADCDDRSGLYQQVLQKTGVLCGIGVIIFGVGALTCPVLFPFVFGKEWEIAGQMGSWICLWMIFAFMNTPSVSVIPIIDLQKEFLVYEILVLVLRFTVLFYCSTHFDLIDVVKMFALLGCVSNFLLIAYVLFNLKKLEFDGNYNH